MNPEGKLRQKHYQPTTKNRTIDRTMKNTPEIPDDFDSEEELQQYISQLHNHIEFLEDELEDSEKDKLELKQKLEEAQNSSDEARYAKVAAVASILNSLEDKISETEDHLEDRGNLSGEAANTISDITGEQYD